MASGDVRDEPAGAHDRRVAHGRRRALTLGGVAAVSVIVLVVVALWLPATLGLRGGPAPALAGRAPSTTAPTAPPGERGCRSRLTSDSPLRLWIGGDSLAGSLGPSLGKQAAASGIVAPVYDSRVSSGLSTPEFFDWPRHAADEMTRLDPEIAVFVMGANDWSTPQATPTDGSGEPAWRARYAQLVEEMLATLEGDQNRSQPRPVYWVGAPPMQDQGKDAGARQVNAVARAVVARHASATYIDAYELFSAPAGGYTPTLPGPDGTTVRVRAGDGVHFTAEGADLLGVTIYGPLDARCRVDAQAVPGAPKPVLQTKGSTQVPDAPRETTIEVTPESTSSTTGSTIGTTSTTAATSSTTAAAVPPAPSSSP